MKGLIETLRNIFRITELRGRILYTLLLLVAFRFGSFVILPGIDSVELSRQFSASQGQGILGMLNLFVGGSFERGSIFALGIMPYISASIILQLLAAALPALQKLQKEGESGQRKINQYTRLLTVAITFLQAFAYKTNLSYQFPGAIMSTGVGFTVTTVACLTAGTLFLVWLGERITEKGIGNGTSMIIAIGIIADLPLSLLNEWQANPMMIFFVELLGFAFITMIVILLTQATRKIPVNYARRMVGNKMTNPGRTNIPLKLNAAGVMPIIFAQSLMFIPATIAQFFPESQYLSQAGVWFADQASILYNVLFISLIIIFTYFYTAIAVNPNDIADQLKRNGGFIPGVKPGKKTAEYIDAVLTHITLPGAIFLAIIAIIPAIVGQLGVSTQFSRFFGGTSILIMIGVVLETLNQIESYLLMRHYDGLMKSGRTRQTSKAGVTA